MLAAKIIIGLVDPVGTGRVEDVEVHGVDQSLGFVRHVRRDGQNFTGVDHDLPAVDPELQGAIEDIGNLFVVMAMLGHDATLLQQDASHHDVLADHEMTLQQGIEILDRHRAPWDVLQACSWPGGTFSCRLS